MNELFDTWYPRLLRYALGQVRPRAAAEDLVQEVFLDLYEALLAEHSIRYPKAWTICVLKRKATEKRKDPLGMDRIHQDLDGIVEAQADQREANLDRTIECHRLRRHLNVLSAREEEVLLLRLEAMKCREIAEALGISINSVNEYLTRSVEKLQSVLVSKTARKARV